MRQRSHLYAEQQPAQQVRELDPLAEPGDQIPLAGGNWVPSVDATLNKIA